MLKIAFCAGHDLSTAGKRVPAALDRAQTREWVLNDRIADGFAEAAAGHPEIQLLRTDDPMGVTTVSIRDRTAKANRWGADLYIDMHHNAGIDLGEGGGLTIFSYPGSQKGSTFRDQVYDSLIAAGAPRGNRSQPLREKKLLSLSRTKMPAILIEYGFMDSPADWEIISDPGFGERMGRATLEAVLGRLPRQQFLQQLQGEMPTISATKNRNHRVVAAVQKRLYQLGYSQVGEADGIAGPKFTAAVKAFQKEHGCVVDGELTAGQKTWRELVEA